jgi:hypothetical protein
MASKSTHLATTPVVREEDEDRVLPLADRLQVDDQAPDVLIEVVNEGGVVLLQARVHLLLVVVEGPPGHDAGRIGG